MEENSTLIEEIPHLIKLGFDRRICAFIEIARHPEVNMAMLRRNMDRPAKASSRAGVEAFTAKRRRRITL